MAISFMDIGRICLVTMRIPQGVYIRQPGPPSVWLGAIRGHLGDETAYAVLFFMALTLGSSFRHFTPIFALRQVRGLAGGRLRGDGPLRPRLAGVHAVLSRLRR